MDGGKCIFMLRGVRPFLSDKYDLTRHPNYRYTADADPMMIFPFCRSHFAMCWHPARRMLLKISVP